MACAPRGSSRLRRLSRRPSQARSPQPAARSRRRSTTRLLLPNSASVRRTGRSVGRGVADLETRIAAHETAIKALEAEMSAPGFYEQREGAQTQLTRHQTLMWEVGELMQQWEMLSETDESGKTGDA